jgi:tetratricopeptide (TPR) repeat protein
VLQQTTIRDVLRRMQKPATTFVDFKQAREIATREGIRAVLDGSLLGLGGKYVVSVRLVSPQSGDVLAHFSENANSAADLLPTIDKLAKEVRAKIGESLRNVQATPPLEQVTTPSLDALRKYVAGNKAISVDGDFAKGTGLLEEAIALDTGFAMAYRKLSVAYTNRGVQDKGAALLEKAYAHRDRLSDAERYLVTGTYFQNGSHQDYAQAQAAYEQLLEIQPDNPGALNNLGSIYNAQRKYANARDAFAKLIATRGAPAVAYENLARAYSNLGQADSAERMLDELAKLAPSNLELIPLRMELAASRQQYDSALTFLSGNRSRLESDKGQIGNALYTAAYIAKARGRLRDARSLLHDGWADAGAAGLKEAPIMDAGDAAEVLAWYLGDSTAALRLIADSLARHPVDSIAELSGPMSTLVHVYALAHRPDQASAMFAKWQAAHRHVSYADDSLTAAGMRGDIALAQDKPAEALAEYRRANAWGCAVCIMPLIAQAYDRLGNADSAIAVFTRFVETPAIGRVYSDGDFLAGAYKRLGELYEAKGDRQHALTYYMKFADLWNKADPELQPKVAEVRARIARLSKVEGG